MSSVLAYNAKDFIGIEPNKIYEKPPDIGQILKPNFDINEKRNYKNNYNGEERRNSFKKNKKQNKKEFDKLFNNEEPGKQRTKLLEQYKNITGEEADNNLTNNQIKNKIRKISGRKK
jgi:hypothetical protein